MRIPKKNFLGSGSCSAEKKSGSGSLNFKKGKKIELKNHNFKLELVDSCLYYVQDENNFIKLFLKEGSGRQKSTDPTGSSSLIFSLSGCVICGPFKDNLSQSAKFKKL